MIDELSQAVERAEIGWNRDEARQTLAQSMETITIASRLARKAVTEIEMHAADLLPDVEDLHKALTNMRAEGLSSARGSGTLTRSQAVELLASCKRLVTAFDIGNIVKLSLDLTNQSRVFVEMMDKIDKRYGAEDQHRAEDMSEHLTSEQLLQVLQWVKENKEAAVSG